LLIIIIIVIIVSLFGNKQLYTAVSPDEIHVGRQRLMSCISELQQWCASRRLQLNASKTELIWFGSRTSFRRLSSADKTFTIDSVVNRPMLSVTSG